MQIRRIAADIFEIESNTPLGPVNQHLIVTADGLVLIDCGLPDDGRVLQRACTELQLSLDQLRWVVVTHHHIDHAGNLAWLRRHTAAATAMHVDDAAMVQQGCLRRPNLQATPQLGYRLLWALAGQRMPGALSPATVDVLLNDGDELPFVPGLRVVHAPGHSAGQIALHWPQRKLLWLADSAIQLAGAVRLPPVCEEPLLLRPTLEKLTALAAETLCFGHGAAVIGDGLRVMQRWRAAS
jgi:glyoxylase-like metal-dependent hydrolase (beta-lactamase superfamily II)